MLDFIFGKKKIQRALEEHAAETGEQYELIKAGIPPLRLWLRNGKGDKWGKVVDENGTESWVRYRVRLFSNKPPLTFF